LKSFLRDLNGSVAKSLHVLLQLRHLRLGVALSDDEEIDLLRRGTVVEIRPDPAGRPKVGGVHEAR